MNYTHQDAIKLNKQMKPFEKVYNYKLKNNKLYILRFDGVNMTKNFLKQSHKIFPFLKTMKDALSIFMLQNKNLKIAYSETDEISIVLDTEFIEKHKYRMEKVLTIITSQITYAFHMAAIENNLVTGKHIYCFDGRIVEVEKMEDISNYFISRQVFNISRLLGMLNHQHFNQVDYEDGEELKKKLQRISVPFDGIDEHQRYGILWVNGQYTECFDFYKNQTKLMDLLMGKEHIFQKKKKQKYYNKKRGKI